MKMSVIFVLFSSLFLVYLSGCNSDVNPVYPFSKNVQSSYNWKSQSFSLDEIGYIHQISGISEKDIWAAAAFGTLHYDGNSWKLLPKTTLNGPFSICALGSSDVWSSTHGENGYVEMRHFDGSSWSRFGRYRDSSYFCEIQHMTAAGQNSMYAVGIKSQLSQDTSGIIMRYDGTEWSFVRIPEINLEFYKICRDASGKNYIGAQRCADSPMKTRAELIRVFEFNGTEITELQGSAGLEPVDINGKTYFVDENNKLFSYSNGSFKLEKEFGYSSYYLTPVAGENINDMYICAYALKSSSGGANAYLLHYDGKDLSVILSFRGMMKAAVLGSGIFAALQKEDKSFMLMHGRKK